VNIILFGPPGAGKGTQADNLMKEFNFFKASTGDLLREEVKKKSSLSNKIKSTIDKGLLVSDDIIGDLVENILSNKTYFNRVIFDGYPRNLNQVKNLYILIKKYNQKISCALSLKVDQEIIIKRILGRQVCSKCDDNEKTTRRRFVTYHKETLPILDYYRNQNLLYEIDGMRDISIIYKEIRQIIRSLET